MKNAIEATVWDMESQSYVTFSVGEAEDGRGLEYEFNGEVARSSCNSRGEVTLVFGDRKIVVPHYEWLIRVSQKLTPAEYWEGH